MPRIDVVIEITPWSFAPERAAPPTTRAADPAAWREYRAACFAEANLPCLPTVGDTDFVRLASLAGLDAAHVSALLKLPDLHDVDGVLPLNGGLSIQDDDTVLLTPQCCSDLGDLLAWEEKVRAPPNEWTPLCIGHPEISVRASGPTLACSQLIEPGSSAARPEAAFSVALDELRDAMQRIRSERVAFLPALEAALALAAVPLPASEAAALLLGL
jgi:hypothetical protein